jgi:hypothetical protein
VSADTDKTGLGLVAGIQTPTSVVWREIDYGTPDDLGFCNVRLKITVERGTAIKHQC